MARTNTRISVRTDALIASLEEEIERRKKDHRDALRDYPKRIADWQQTARNALQKALSEVEKVKVPKNTSRTYNYKTDKYDREVRIPSFPTKPTLDICSLESRVKGLKSSSKVSYNKVSYNFLPEELETYFPCRLSRNGDG